MNEDKLGEWLDRLEEAKRKSVEQEYPSPVDLHSLSEAREAILAAFAELRAERDKLLGEASHNLTAYYDTLEKLNAEHVKLVNAEASESNWRAVAKKYKLVLLEIYASGSPDDRFWQLAMNVLLAEGDDWRKI